MTQGGVTKEGTPSGRIWKANHEQIRKAIDDLGRLEFSVRELHERLPLIGGRKISLTRLRTHLDGYDPKKQGHKRHRLIDYGPLIQRKCRTKNSNNPFPLGWNLGWLHTMPPRSSFQSS